MGKLFELVLELFSRLKGLCGTVFAGKCFIVVKEYRTDALFLFQFPTTGQWHPVKL